MRFSQQHRVREVGFCCLNGDSCKAILNVAAPELLTEVPFVGGLADSVRGQHIVEDLDQRFNVGWISAIEQTFTEYHDFTANEFGLSESDLASDWIELVWIAKYNSTDEFEVVSFVARVGTCTERRRSISCEQNRSENVDDAVKRSDR